MVDVSLFYTNVLPASFKRHYRRTVCPFVVVDRLCPFGFLKCPLGPNINVKDLLHWL